MHAMDRNGACTMTHTRISSWMKLQKLRLLVMGVISLTLLLLISCFPKTSTVTFADCSTEICSQNNSTVINKLLVQEKFSSRIPPGFFQSTKQGPVKTILKYFYLLYISCVIVRISTILISWFTTKAIVFTDIPGSCY